MGGRGPVSWFLHPSKGRVSSVLDPYIPSPYTFSHQLSGSKSLFRRNVLPLCSSDIDLPKLSLYSSLKDFEDPPFPPPLVLSL